MTEESRKVAEARENVWVGMGCNPYDAGTHHRGGCDCAKTLDVLVEAVRKENGLQRDELFARVAQLEQWVTVEHNEASKFAIERNKWRTKAEAAEERVAELETLVEAVRKDERERIFGVPDEERAKWGHGLNGLVGDY